MKQQRYGSRVPMLARALALNEPKDMPLVDVDNAAAIRLYESTGFVRAVGKTV